MAWTFPRPLQGSYAASLAVALLALVPFIVVSTATPLYQEQVIRATGGGRTGLAIIAGLSEGGYAFGALLGGDLAQRFPQWPTFLVLEGLFVLGAALAAAAGGVVLYGTGVVLLGVATGMMLIVALPPVIQRFPPARMPVTAAMINIGFFGAVTVGPLLGGAVAAVLGLALFTLPDTEPPNRDLPFDVTGIILGLGSAVLLFVAAGELSGHGFASAAFIVPLVLGGGCFVALVLVEYHKEQSLSPIHLMWTTYPLVGTLAASMGGAAYVTFLELGMDLLRRPEGLGPLATGLSFWPQVLGVGVTATLLGLLLRSRYLPLLVLAGMLTLLGGGALLAAGQPAATAATWAAAGLLGLGAGATVSPGLYLAGFSLRSQMLGRIFAIVELVRSIADYLMAPVMRKIARQASGGAPTVEGVHDALWITLAVTGGATLLGLGLYLAGGWRLPRPDVDGWLTEGREAVRSPPLAAVFRGSQRLNQSARPRP